MTPAETDSGKWFPLEPRLGPSQMGLSRRALQIDGKFAQIVSVHLRQIFIVDVQQDLNACVEDAEECARVRAAPVICPLTPKAGAFMYCSKGGA